MSMKMLKAVPFAVCFGLLVVCSLSMRANENIQGQEDPKVVRSGIEADLLDKKTAPGDDFFGHVNGIWLDKTEIPADKSNYGSFGILQEQANVALREIVESMAELPDSKPGSTEQKVGDFYRAFMDTQKLEELGADPIRPLVARVRDLKSKDELIDLLGEWQRQGISSVFACFVNSDARDSDRNIVYITQSGITLPDRDYYLKDEPKEKRIREAYHKYIAGLMKLIGEEHPNRIAERVIRLETKIAELQWTRVENRNPLKTYNKKTNEQLNELLKEFDWNRFAAIAGLGKQTEFVVRQPSFLEGVDELLKLTALEAWQDYLTFHVVDGFAAMLSKDFDDLSFELHEKTLSGVAEPSVRWKRAVRAANSSMGELVGELYVRKHFTPAAKARMGELVANLRSAMGVRIQQLDWMSDATKKRSQEKLKKIRTKIGYPDKWKDYSKLVIKPDDLVGNMRRAQAVAYQRMLDKLGKPVDRGQWLMTPQTVNAYYNPMMNEIVFPAAILQPPFFFMDADDAVNYGGIGAVIGHELSHGFDDSGSRFDGDGNLNNWWTAEDRSEFEKRANQLVAQYSEYEPIPGMKLNGKLTLGENIGDLGGINIALEAYKISLKGKPAPVLDGLNGQQRFFMGFGQIFRRKYRPEELRRRLFVDPHSPSRFRVNGIVRNVDAFYEEFEVEPGQKLYLPPKQRVRIW